MELSKLDVEVPILNSIGKLQFKLEIFTFNSKSSTVNLKK